jgi:hypothetical protein
MTDSKFVIPHTRCWTSDEAFRRPAAPGDNADDAAAAMLNLLDDGVGDTFVSVSVTHELRTWDKQRASAF